MKDLNFCFQWSSPLAAVFKVHAALLGLHISCSVLVHSWKEMALIVIFLNQLGKVRNEDAFNIFFSKPAPHTCPACAWKKNKEKGSKSLIIKNDNLHLLHMLPFLEFKQQLWKSKLFRKWMIITFLILLEEMLCDRLISTKVR